MVHDGLTLHLRGLEWLICISLITDLFYMLVYYLYFLLCIVYVLCSSSSFIVTQEPHELTTYSTPEPRVQVVHSAALTLLTPQLSAAVGGWGQGRVGSHFKAAIELSCMHSLRLFLKVLDSFS